MKAQIKPSKTSLLIGIIVLSFFLLFGIVFFVVISNEPESYIGQSFLTFWNLIIIAMLVFFIYSYKNYEKKNVLGNEIVMDRETKETGTALPFDEKLKKLESLKNQGLINDEEYQIKRKEILKEKW